MRIYAPPVINTLLFYKLVYTLFFGYLVTISCKPLTGNGARCNQTRNFGYKHFRLNACAPVGRSVTKNVTKLRLTFKTLLHAIIFNTRRTYRVKVAERFKHAPNLEAIPARDVFGVFP